MTANKKRIKFGVQGKLIRCLYISFTVEEKIELRHSNGF